MLAIANLVLIKKKLLRLIKAIMIDSGIKEHLLFYNHSLSLKIFPLSLPTWTTLKLP